SKAAAWMAVGCIATGFVCSTAALLTWGSATHWSAFELESAHAEQTAGSETAPAAPEGEHAEHAHSAADVAHAQGHAAEGHGDPEHTHPAHGNNPFASAFSGTFYELGRFGRLSVSLDYYIDGLTLAMFCMVTLCATCIHVFATGYMSDELTDDLEDHE